jgi:hypothetical protein
VIKTARVKATLVVLCLIMFSSFAYADHCGEPGAGRACYDPGEIGPNEGTYVGVFRHLSGSGCPWAEGVPGSILLANGSIRSNGWIGDLKSSGSFTLRSGQHVVTGRVDGGEARAVYQHGMCRVDFLWKKVG